MKIPNVFHDYFPSHFSFIFPQQFQLDERQKTSKHFYVLQAKPASTKTAIEGHEKLRKCFHSFLTYFFRQKLGMRGREKGGEGKRSENENVFLFLFWEKTFHSFIFIVVCFYWTHIPPPLHSQKFSFWYSGGMEIMIRKTRKSPWMCAWKYFFFLFWGYEWKFMLRYLRNLRQPPQCTVAHTRKKMLLHVN